MCDAQAPPSGGWLAGYSLERQVAWIWGPPRLPLEGAYPRAQRGRKGSLGQPAVCVLCYSASWLLGHPLTEGVDTLANFVCASDRSIRVCKVNAVHSKVWLAFGGSRCLRGWSRCTDFVIQLGFCLMRCILHYYGRKQEQRGVVHACAVLD